LTDLHTQPQPGQTPALELVAYLVMPISRIPRYMLLLEVCFSLVYRFVCRVCRVYRVCRVVPALIAWVQAILKCTLPDHPEHDTLRKVQAQLRLMADGINASMRQVRTTLHQASNSLSLTHSLTHTHTHTTATHARVTKALMTIAFLGG
jgi:hypothetical protein